MIVICLILSEILIIKKKKEIQFKKVTNLNTKNKIK